MSESGDYDNIASDDDLKPDLIVREIDFAEEYTPEDDKEHRIAPNQKHPHSKWHDEINKKLRLLIKSEITQDNFKFHYGSYLTSLKEHLPFLLRNPKHCRQVAKKMSRTLLLFRSLYSNTTEIDLYHTKMCELLSILTTLELTYASNFDELKIEIVKRLCTNYDIHLRNLDATHILTVFLYLYSYYISNMKQKKGWTIFDQTEILTKIFEKYLKKFPNIKQTKLNDKLYCMYIAAYSFWINIENDVYEKNNIIRYANQVIAPKPSLRLNKTYFQYLAKYPPDEQNVTKFIFDRGINRAGLVKILIEEDNCKDIIINVEWGETQHPVIDLDEDLAGKSFENLTLTEEVKFKPVGQPSVVATIDLTDDKMDEDDARNCPWLDKLIKLTRQARKSRRCQNKNSSNIEIINLDSDNDYEEYEENEEDKENEESKQHTESEKENENHYDKQSRTDELITEPNKQAEIYTAQNTEGNADERVNNKTVVQKDCVTSEENEHKKEKKNSNDNYLDGKISKTNTINQETETIAKIVEEERGQSINSCDENKKEQNKSNKTPARENESQICSVEVFQKDTITQTTEEGVQSSSVEEGKEKTSEDKGEAVLTHADLDKSISSSSNQATEDEILAGFVPIFDENLTFVTNYVTKTYSNKQTVKNLQNDSNNIEDSETHSEINDKEGNSKQNKEISNECNYEITSSTLLNDDYESENNNLKSACSNKQRKVNPEKIVHRFIATKKVNFAPLPEKHIPKKPVKYSSINQMRRNSISIDKIQNSFIPPPGTEAFKLYETQKDSSLVKDSSNNLQTQNNTQNSNDLSHVAGSIEKSIQTSNVNNFGVSSPTKTNITSESRPTAEAILAATIHKTSGHGDISGMKKDKNIIDSGLKTLETKNLLNDVVSVSLSKNVTDTSIETNSLNLYPDSTVGDDSSVLGCESDNNLSSNNANFNSTINNNKKCDNSVRNEKEDDFDNDINQKLSGSIGIFSQNFLNEKDVNFEEFSEEDDETNLSNVDDVDKSLLPIIQEADYPDVMHELAELLINSTYDDSYKDLADNLNPLYYNKKVEGQTSLPLKKRRKLSTFSDNLSLKDEDLTFLDFQRIRSLEEEQDEASMQKLIQKRQQQMQQESEHLLQSQQQQHPQPQHSSQLKLQPQHSKVPSQQTFFYQQQCLQTQQGKQPQQQQEGLHRHQKQNQTEQQQLQAGISSFLDGISYPSTPMLSIANFENMINRARYANRQSQQHQRLINSPLKQTRQTNLSDFSQNKFNNVNQKKDLNNSLNLQNQDATHIKNNYIILDRNVKAISQQNRGVITEKIQPNLQSFNAVETVSENKTINFPHIISSETISNNNSLTHQSNNSANVSNIDSNIYKESLPSIQTLNALTNTFQYMRALQNHPISNLTNNNLQQWQDQLQLQSFTSKRQLPLTKTTFSNNIQMNNENKHYKKDLSFKQNIERQDICTNNEISLDVDMNNYNLNHQHLNNYLYNSQHNWIAKQNILRHIRSNSYKQSQQNEKFQNDVEYLQNRSFLMQHAPQTQISVHDTYQHPNSSFAEVITSPTVTSPQPKSKIKPSGKPQAFREFMTSKVTNSETITNQTFCECNQINDTHFYQGNYTCNENSQKQISSNEKEEKQALSQSSITRGQKRKSKICAEERITRASNRNKAHDAQKKSEINSNRKKK